jgi:hypothetical protein
MSVLLIFPLHMPPAATMLLGEENIAVSSVMLAPETEDAWAHVYKLVHLKLESSALHRLVPTEESVVTLPCPGRESSQSSFNACKH